MDSRFAYNGILGRFVLKQLKAIILNHHLYLNLEILKEIAKVKGNQAAARECYINAPKKAAPKAPVVNTILTIERNMLEKPLFKKQISDVMKDELKNLSIGKIIL